MTHVSCHVTLAVYHAVCLEELTARAFLLKLLEKVGWLSIDQVSSFLQLTGIGLLVKVDDSLVLSMQDEDSFLVRTVKGKCACGRMVCSI